MLKGSHHTTESKLKNSNTHKGMAVWNKGKRGVMPTPWNKGKKFISKSNEKHFAWKGDGATYQAKHMWVYPRLGKPTTCEHCKKTGLVGHQIHWANISGDYKRDVSDWIRLCAKCHSKYDKEKNERTYK